MIVSSSATRILIAGEHDLGAQAAVELRSSVPRSSSRTSASTIERPVPDGSSGDPAAVVGDREHDVAVPPASSTRTESPPCSSAFWSSSLKTSASAVARLPASETGSSAVSTRLPGAEPLDEHRAQPVEQLVEVDVVVALLGQHLVHRGDREDPVDRVVERLARVDLLAGARLKPQQRGDGLEVVLDPVVDLLGEDAAHHRPAVLERDRGVVRDRREQRALLLRERRVAVADELADRPALPAQRDPDRMRAGRPSGQAMFPSSRTSAAPVAPTASIVVCTIASSDSSR